MRRSALSIARAATALDEYNQGASIVPPATLADLAQGFDPTVWEDIWKDWSCAWRQLARIEKKIPPSWKFADLVITARIARHLLPSLRRASGTNLVIFPANIVDGDQIAVHDPDHHLPHDQSSWP